MYLSELLNVFVQIKKCIWFQIDYSIEAVTFEVWLEIKWLDPNSTSAHARTLPPHCFCSRPTASDLFFIIRTMQCNAMIRRVTMQLNTMQNNAIPSRIHCFWSVLYHPCNAMKWNTMEYNWIHCNTLVECTALHNSSWKCPPPLPNAS